MMEPSVLGDIMSFSDTMKSIFQSWDSPDGTRLSHQIRDQLLHLGYGAIAGLVSAQWWQGLVAACAYGAIREGEQWGTLKTPSLKDSLIDWSFVSAGGLIGGLIRQFLIGH